MLPKPYSNKSPHITFPPLPSPITLSYLFGHGMRRNILHGIPHAPNPVRLRIRNLHRKFILNGHDDLDGIQGIQTKIFAEFGSGADLGRVDFVKVFDDGEDSFLDFGGGEEGLFFVVVVVVVVGDGNLDMEWMYKRMM